MRSSHYLVLTLLCLAVARADDGVIDSVMYRQPVIPVAKAEPTFDPGLVNLWIAALDRPDVETRTAAATAIALAHKQGMPGLAVTIDPLRRELDKADQHPNVRLAAAKALVALDAKAAADSLLKLSESSADLREATDAALARWDHTPARQVWLDRLTKPSPYLRSHLLAARSLATVREAKALPRLRELVHAPDLTAPLRLEVARALSVIQPSGLEADARRCTSDPLAAVTLLRQHTGDDAVKLLQEFAARTEPSVATVAVERLLAIDPKLALPGIDAVLANKDSETRRLGAEVLLRLPRADHVPKLVPLLNDTHPDVRNHARRAMVKYAESAELRTIVEDRLTMTLNGSDWRGQEQAALLAGQLKHTPVSKRLVEQLTAKRAEAFIAAAWALRQMAVPDTLPAVTDHVKSAHRKLLALGPTAGLDGVTGDEVDRQLTQLVQFIGQAKYKPADATVRALIPRFVPSDKPPGSTPVGGETRAATMWALGELHADDPDPRLTETILGRLTGDPGMGRDDPRVRAMVPVAMVRMKAKGSLATLKEHTEGDKPTLNVVLHACRWAVAQMEGKPAPTPEVVKVPQNDWFLIPHK